MSLENDGSVGPVDAKRGHEVMAAKRGPEPVALLGLQGRERELALELNVLLAERETLIAELDERTAALQNSVHLQHDTLRSLAAIRRIANSMRGRFELDQICTQMVHAIAHELRIEHCSVMLLDPTGNELRLEAGASLHPLPKGTVPTTSCVLRVGEGVAGQVARSGRAIRISDVQADPRWVDGDTRVEVRSLMCLPLFGGGELLGVINVSHPQPDYFDHQHERVFSVFCPIVGQFFWFAREASFPA